MFFPPGGAEGTKIENKREKVNWVRVVHKQKMLILLNGLRVYFTLSFMLSSGALPTFLIGV